MQFLIHTIEEWPNVVDSLLPHLKHNILLLQGNLGAGKTTFTQHLLKKLGSNDEVSSPTYAIVNEYHTPEGPVFHFDLYRMKSLEEVYDIGMDDYLENARLCIIEWPEIYLPELDGLPYHSMHLETDGHQRKIEFHSFP